MMHINTRKKIIVSINNLVQDAQVSKTRNLMTHHLVEHSLVHARSAMMLQTTVLHQVVASYTQCHRLRNQFLQKRRKNHVLDI